MDGRDGIIQSPISIDGSGRETRTALTRLDKRSVGGAMYGTTRGRRERR